MKFKGTWLPERVYKEYKNSCKNVNLSNFKTNPKYIGVVGNDTRKYDITEKFYSYVEDNYNTLLNYYDKFSTNDKIGSPVIHKFSNYIFSCGTLRFIKVVGDIFLKMKWDVNSIVEIGCGYGGQVKIFKDYKPNIDYTCVDIPEACMLITKYLNYFKLLDSVKIQDTSNIKPIKADLVISDYCLSELDKDGVDFYIDTFIRDAKYGYFTINKQSPVRNHLLNRLKEVFDIVLIEAETPATSRHKNEILYCI